MTQIHIAFEKFELSEKDGIAQFVAESLAAGKYNGFNITLEELTKAAPLWLGADVLLGHSDTIIGEITYSALENGKLIQKGTLDDPKAVNLIKKGKLKPSIGASSKFERRQDGIYATDITADHLALVRQPACKQCTIKIAMSEALELAYKTVNDLPEKLSENQESFIKSFSTASGIEVQMTEEELKAKHEIELKDLKLKHESEIKAINLKLESTEKELKTYKEAEKIQYANKLLGAELRLGAITRDQYTVRAEELKKLELSDIKEKYILAMEELNLKIQKGQGKVELGEHSDTKTPMTLGSYDPVKKEWI